MSTITTRVDLGIICDWDGVIIDSSQRHEESWECLAREAGRPLPAGHFKRGFGKKNAEIIPDILGWTHDPAEVERLSRRKEVLYRQLVVERGIEALPGVRPFLEQLVWAGIPCCIGSSTERENIAAILRLLHFQGLFAGVIAAEDVGRGKPDPEVFLKAAAKIGRAPRQCLVCEDAPAGLAAARAGGMKVVAVAGTHPAESLAGLADRVVRRLDELTVEDLGRLVHG